MVVEEEAEVIAPLIRHMYDLRAWPSVNCTKLDDSAVEEAFHFAMRVWKAVDKVSQVFMSTISPELTTKVSNL